MRKQFLPHNDTPLPPRRQKRILPPYHHPPLLLSLKPVPIHLPHQPLHSSFEQLIILMARNIPIIPRMHQTQPQPPPPRPHPTHNLPPPPRTIPLIHHPSHHLPKQPRPPRQRPQHRHPPRDGIPAQHLRQRTEPRNQHHPSKVPPLMQREQLAGGGGDGGAEAVADEHDARGRHAGRVHGPVDGGFGVEDEPLLRGAAAAEAEAAVVEG